MTLAWKRDATDDQITIDAANAIKEHRVGVKYATITPDEARVEEFDLKKCIVHQMAQSEIFYGGTVFRQPIICSNMPRLVLGWTRPIVVGRHAFGDQYRATDMVVKGAGTLTLTFQPADAAALPHLTKSMISLMAALRWRCITLIIIRGFARACMNYGLDLGWPVYLSTKEHHYESL